MLFGDEGAKVPRVCENITITATTKFQLQLRPSQMAAFNHKTFDPTTGTKRHSVSAAGAGRKHRRPEAE